jgi:hypothetical protein
LLKENEWSWNQFIVPIERKGGVFKIFIDDKDGKEDWIDLTQLEMISYERDELRIYKYFLAYLELLANLCYQRNYKAIEPIADVYPLDLLYGCASD